MDQHRALHILPKYGLPFLVGALTVGGIFTSSLYSYLLFHSLVEIVNVLAAFLIFVLAWHTRHVQDNRYLMFVGVASLFTGSLDLLHTLAYKGMGIFLGYTADLPTQLWIAFRYVASLSFVSAPFFISRKISIGNIFSAYLGITAILVFAIFSGRFPSCFVEGAGLTPFKVASEYVISLLFLAALGLLLWKREAFDQRVLWLMSGSILASVAAELAFTQYVSVYGPANMIGHFFLLASVVFIYQAFVVTGIVEPASLLFRNLQRNQEALRQSEAKYRSLFENMSKGFAYHRLVLDEAGKPVDYVFLELNTAFESLTGLKRTDILGKRVTEALPGIEHDPADWIGTYGKVALTGEAIRFEQHAEALGKWYSVSAYCPMRGYFATIFEDITARKRAEKEREHLLSEVQRYAGELDTVFKALPYLVSVHAIDGRYLRVNPALVSLFGFDPTNADREEIARRVKAHFPDGRPLTPENMPSSRALKGEAVYGVEYQITNEQGETHDLLMNAIPLQVAGHIYGVVIAQMDITERKRIEEELSKSTELLQAVSSGTDDAIFVKDLDSRLLLANPATLRIIGKNAEEVFGRTDAEIYSDPEIGRTILKTDRRIMDSGKTEIVEEIVDGPEGRRVFLSTKSPRFDAQGRVIGLIGISRDITKRKLVEERLRELTQQLAYHVDNSPLAVIEWGPDMRLTRWSGAAEHVFGWKAEEVLGKRMDDFRWIYQEDEPQVEEISADLRSGASPRRFSANRNYRKDGSVIYCEWYNSSLVDASGNLRSILSLVLDVTDRKRAEEALLQSEATLRGILDATNESVWLFSSDGLAILANRTGVHRLGKKIEDVIGKHLGDIVPPDVALTRMERLHQVVASGQPVDFEDTRDGMMFHHSLYPVFGRNGRVVGVASFSRDITERKRIDQALAKKTGELEDLNKNLEARVEEELRARRRNEQILTQQSKLAAMGEMISAIAHQWRQPLNVVGLIVQNMQEVFEQGKLDSDHMDRSVRKTMAQIEHMSRTIDDFRSFIIPDKEKRAFDAMRAVGNVLSLLSTQLSGDRITCRLTCHSHGETIHDQKDISECAEKTIEGYQNEFEHVVFNLVNNARDAILEKRRSDNGDKSEPGLLSFDFYNRDGRVIVEISDNGSGIPAAVMDRIFEPYFSTKDMTKGTGIGLYMSKVIVEDHLNGTLTAKNHEGGAMFTISLPQAWTKGSS